MLYNDILLCRNTDNRGRITGSKYKSTKETTNLARAARMILGPCTNVLRRVLRNIIDELEDIPDDLQLSAEEGDISNLYDCFRNVLFEFIEPNIYLWGKHPKPSDTSLLANIERIRLARNDWYAHVEHYYILDSDYEKIWNDLFQAVKGIEDNLNIGTCNQIAIIEIKSCDMEHDSKITYIVKLIEQIQKEISISTGNVLYS